MPDLSPRQRAMLESVLADAAKAVKMAREMYPLLTGSDSSRFQNAEQGAAIAREIYSDAFNLVNDCRRDLGMPTLDPRMFPIGQREGRA